MLRKATARGVPEDEAERRAWATVNKDDGGGKKLDGSGRGKRTGHPAARRGGQLGGASVAKRQAAAGRDLQRQQRRVEGELQTLSAVTVIRESDMA